MARADGGLSRPNGAGKSTSLDMLLALRKPTSRRIRVFGWSWMRGPQAMIPVLEKILPSTPFAGLGVFTTSLGIPEPMQTHLAIASTVQPETTTLVEQAAHALNLNAYNA